ncbi:gfo/Idh/MocA family oxidoreductase, partial [Candidatus Woesearchaeota archaeon]
IYRDDEVREIRPTVDSYLEEDRTFIRAVTTGDGSEIRSPYSDAVKTLEVTIAANRAAEEGRIVAIQ